MKQGPCWLVRWLVWHAIDALWRFVSILLDSWQLSSVIGHFELTQYKYSDQLLALGSPEWIFSLVIVDTNAAGITVFRAIHYIGSNCFLPASKTHCFLPSLDLAFIHSFARAFAFCVPNKLRSYVAARVTLFVRNQQKKTSDLGQLHR